MFSEDETLRYLEAAVAVDQYIIRLDVAVNDVQRMNVFHSWKQHRHYR